MEISNRVVDSALHSRPESHPPLSSPTGELQEKHSISLSLPPPPDLGVYAPQSPHDLVHRLHSSQNEFSLHPNAAVAAHSYHQDPHRYSSLLAAAAATVGSEYLPRGPYGNILGHGDPTSYPPTSDVAQTLSLGGLVEGVEQDAGVAAAAAALNAMGANPSLLSGRVGESLLGYGIAPPTQRSLPHQHRPQPTASALQAAAGLVRSSRGSFSSPQGIYSTAGPQALVLPQTAMSTYAAAAAAGGLLAPHIDKSLPEPVRKYCVGCGEIVDSFPRNQPLRACRQRLCGRLVCPNCYDHALEKGVRLYHMDSGLCAVCEYQQKKRPGGSISYWHSTFHDQEDLEFVRTLRDGLPTVNGLFLEVYGQRQACWRRRIGGIRKHYSFKQHGGYFESRLQSIFQQQREGTNPSGGSPGSLSPTTTVHSVYQPYHSAPNAYQLASLGGHPGLDVRNPWGQPQSPNAPHSLDPLTLSPRSILAKCGVHPDTPLDLSTPVKYSQKLLANYGYGEVESPPDFHFGAPVPDPLESGGSAAKRRRLQNEVEEGLAALEKVTVDGTKAEGNSVEGGVAGLEVSSVLNYGPPHESQLATTAPEAQGDDVNNSQVVVNETSAAVMSSGGSSDEPRCAICCNFMSARQQYGILSCQAEHCGRIFCGQCVAEGRNHGIAIFHTNTQMCLICTFQHKMTRIGKKTYMPHTWHFDFSPLRELDVDFLRHLCKALPRAPGVWLDLENVVWRTNSQVFLFSAHGGFLEARWAAIQDSQANAVTSSSPAGSHPSAVAAEGPSCRQPEISPPSSHSYEPSNSAGRVEGDPHVQTV